MRFSAGITTVSTAGGEQQVKDSTDRVLWVKFTAPTANSGLTYVGTSTVTSSAGYPLGASGGADATLELDFRGGSVLANVFYVDSASDGDKVAWAFVLE